MAHNHQATFLISVHDIPTSKWSLFFFREICYMTLITKLLRKDLLLTLHHLLCASADPVVLWEATQAVPQNQLTHLPFLSPGHSDSCSMYWHISLISWCWITFANHRPWYVLLGLLKPGLLSFSLSFSFVCEKQKAKTSRLLYFQTTE